MNKGVLITNIQKIKTNIEQTIENLSSMLGKEKIYSKDQIQKNIDLLQVKLQNDDNYKIVSNRSNDLNLLIKKLESEKSTLRKLIKDIEFRNNLLSRGIEEEQANLGYEQKEYEQLAKSLDVAENHEEIYEIIKEKRVIIDNLKTSMNLEKEKMAKNDEDINRYKESISELEVLEQDYRDELDLVDDYEIDETKKSEDFKKLSRFNGIVRVIDSINEMVKVIEYLDNLIEYLRTREADLHQAEERIVVIKQMIGSLNGVLIEYLALIKLDECVDEQGRIKERLNDEDGYFLSDSERKIINDEIFSLNLDIALCEGQCSSDDQTLVDYDNMIKKINDDIKKENANNFVLQNEINELTLRKAYFISDSNKSDDIDREIKKKQRKINNSKKHIEKLMKNKIYYEFTVTNIKKKKRNSESLIEDKKQVLNEKKELTLNNLTSRYSLDEDKTNLLYLDLIIELHAMASGIIKYNYLKKLDEVHVESLDPFVSIVSCYPYDNATVLYDEEFIESVKSSMNKLIYKASGNPEKYIEYLAGLGVTVVRHGKALQSMDKEKEISKAKVLGGDNSGK